MWAVTPLAGVNDSEEDARALARCARNFQQKTGLRPQIRVIPYNPINGQNPREYKRSDDGRELSFRHILFEEGFSARKRYSGGADVQAACGQLTGSDLQKSKNPEFV